MLIEERVQVTPIPSIRCARPRARQYFLWHLSARASIPGICECGVGRTTSGDVCHSQTSWWHTAARTRTSASYNLPIRTFERAASIEMGFCYSIYVHNTHTGIEWWWCAVCMARIHVIFHESHTRHPYEIIIIGIIAAIKKSPTKFYSGVANWVCVCAMCVYRHFRIFYRIRISSVDGR